jgi:PAS domain S-box-containing protein
MTTTFTDDNLHDGYDRLTRQIVESAPLLLYIYDMQSQQIIYATRSLPWLLGYGEDASTTQAADWLYRLIHSDDKWQLLPSRDSLEAMPPGEVLQTLFRLRHAQGTWRWFSGQAVVFAQDAEGNPRQIVCAAQDITTRKQAEDALIDSRNRATTILESITDAFIALDQEGNFTYVNQHAEDLLQQPRAELLGHPIQERLPEVVDTVFYAQATRALRENIPVSIEAFYAPRSMWVDARVYPSSVGISVYFRD